eukprot:15446246-Alexandrium_andersonii.AAC.1
MRGICTPEFCATADRRPNDDELWDVCVGGGRMELLQPTVAARSVLRASTRCPQRAAALRPAPPPSRARGAARLWLSRRAAGRFPPARPRKQAPHRT